ncbi:MAG: hypothetical protein MUF40_02050 [Gemmatimonadaceae bacterium]|jgi:hypothetical protein|nr:hypothetical protein [Gemmatimonadaceae bacterium]
MAATAIEGLHDRQVTVRRARTASWPWTLAGAAAAGLAWALVPPAPTDATGMQGLVRAFAVLKGALLVGFHALLAWRIRQPIAPGIVRRYGIVLTGMALAPVLAWRGTALPLAFVCFDGGLLVLLVIALGDDGGVRGVRAS